MHILRSGLIERHMIARRLLMIVETVAWVIVEAHNVLGTM